MNGTSGATCWSLTVISSHSRQWSCSLLSGHFIPSFLFAYSGATRFCITSEFLLCFRVLRKNSFSWIWTHTNDALWKNSLRGWVFCHFQKYLFDLRMLIERKRNSNCSVECLFYIMQFDLFLRFFFLHFNVKVEPLFLHIKWELYFSAQNHVILQKR